MGTTLTYGVRQLQAKIGEALRAVARGDRVVVTSRGRTVAVIVPPAEARRRRRRMTLEEKLQEMLAAGKLVQLGKPGPFPPFEGLPIGGVSKQIIADRR